MNYKEVYRFRNVADLRETIFHTTLKQYILVRLDDREVELMPHAVRRMRQVAEDSDAAMVYSCYRERLDDGTLVDHPVIEYQPGSVRDDFDFGALVLLNIADVLSVTEDFTEEDSASLDGGWYALRLRLSTANMLVDLPEYLYTVGRVDYRKSGEKQHDYVNPRQRAYQQEMERVLTEHLYEINALVENFEKVDPEEGDFPVEASVVIPVRNRVNTIRDAVASALSQETDFTFNVIVVDNCSTDGTSEALDAIEDSRLVVIRPQASEGLGIGGCWNRAILSEYCGRYAVQLDSDDVYSSAATLQKIVDKFNEECCAMVVGSYRLTDFQLNELPPGVISHNEWTEENGPNNALRVNGFGAPRAFYTPVVRQILFPNVSYGEDYAVCLRISREYAVGRIYEPLYNCRRWEGNSDAALSVEKVNEHNSYKDFVRSLEVMARIRANSREEAVSADSDDDEEEE
ncbi:MAG: glycosyltransferase [Muribaculum sp.]|nr:glycosyltransferase [Muribaculum sp.]